MLLAREATTLDLLSNGRFELGLGAGVDTGEFQQLGLPSASAGTRVGRLEESLQIIKQLFSEEIVNFTGKYYTIQNMKGSPKSVQQPHIPLLVAGAGERMLKLAAREADTIAIGMKITKQGLDPSDASLEQKLAWIKEASGPRFEMLELSQTVYDMVITDSTTPASQGGWLPVSRRSFTTEQAIAELFEQRSRYGISYLQVSEGQMENFAPIVAQLAGK